MKDKRENIRVLFDAQVDVFSENGEVISNKAKNICLKDCMYSVRRSYQSGKFVI